ncbi:Lipid-translocating exporter-like protein rta1 [Fusarium falciforme]
MSLVVGSLMMSAGYAFRVPSAESPNDLMLYIMQSLFIILPPSLYAATIYMIYGRITLFVRSPQASIIAPERVTKIFVVGDVIAFFLQAGGGGMMASTDMANMGQKIVLGGLFVQLLFFGVFLTVSVLFRVRMRSSSRADDGLLATGTHRWQSLFNLLLFASAIIIARCIFRVIEFAQGHDGDLASNELYMYAFDSAPMLVVQASFHIVHAGDVFTRQRMVYAKQQNESGMELRLAG